jgi:hypothetical protein
MRTSAKLCGPRQSYADSPKVMRTSAKVTDLCQSYADLKLCGPRRYADLCQLCGPLPVMRTSAKVTRTSAVMRTLPKLCGPRQLCGPLPKLRGPLPGMQAPPKLLKWVVVPPLWTANPPREVDGNLRSNCKTGRLSKTGRYGGRATWRIGLARFEAATGKRGGTSRIPLTKSLSPLPAS